MAKKKIGGIKTKKKSKSLNVKKAARATAPVVAKVNKKKRSNIGWIALIFLIVLAVIILLIRNCRVNNQSTLPTIKSEPIVVSAPTMYTSGQKSPAFPATVHQKQKTADARGGLNGGNSTPVTKNSSQDVKDYQSAAAQGDVQAAKNLANLYLNGQGVPKDYHEALKWSLMAANKGDAEAQCCVGLIYDMALGVPQDYKEAMNWYSKSALQGNAVAENCIGYCYENGHGVAQSYDDAVNWYEKSALQGNANAVQNLENMKDLMPAQPTADAETPAAN